MGVVHSMDDGQVDRIRKALDHSAKAIDGINRKFDEIDRHLTNAAAFNSTMTTKIEESLDALSRLDNAVNMRIESTLHVAERATQDVEEVLNRALVIVTKFDLHAELINMIKNTIPLLIPLLILLIELAVSNAYLGILLASLPQLHQRFSTYLLANASAVLVGLFVSTIWLTSHRIHISRHARKLRKQREALVQEAVARPRSSTFSTPCSQTVQGDEMILKATDDQVPVFDGACLQNEVSTHSHEPELMRVGSVPSINSAMNSVSSTSTLGSLGMPSDLPHVASVGHRRRRFNRAGATSQPPPCTDQPSSESRAVEPSPLSSQFRRAPPPQHQEEFHFDRTGGNRHGNPLDVRPSGDGVEICIDAVRGRRAGGVVNDTRLDSGDPACIGQQNSVHASYQALAQQGSSFLFAFPSFRWSFTHKPRAVRQPSSSPTQGKPQNTSPPPPSTERNTGVDTIDVCPSGRGDQGNSNGGDTATVATTSPTVDAGLRVETL